MKRNMPNGCTFPGRLCARRCGSWSGTGWWNMSCAAAWWCTRSEDVEQIYTIRNALEMLTLPDIIQNATAEDIAALREKLAVMDRYQAVDDVESLSPLARDFHTCLTEISGKKRILRVIEGQDEYIRRFSAMAIQQEDRRVAAHQEHHKLVDYVEARDLESFEKLMKAHIERSMENCLAALAARKQNRELP